MKLHHPVTSLAHILDYIEVARHNLYRFGHHYTLNPLLLKLTEHKILRYLSVGIQN